MTARRRRLAERRKALGYSQELLAEQLGTDRTTVGRWERGKTDPYPHIRPKLRQALQVTEDELDVLLTSENEVSLPALYPAPVIAGRVVYGPDPTGEFDDMHRREMLRLLSVAGTLVALPPATDAVGSHWPISADATGDIQHYAQLNVHLWQVFGLSKSKRLVYPLVHDQLGHLIEEMNRIHSPATHKQLCVLACDLFQLAGEIYFDCNRYTDAAHCYALAAAAGRESNSSDRWACALTRQAFVSMYEKQYAQAAEILSVAARVARHGDSQLSTRYWVATVQAQASADLGDRDACNRSLDTADRVIELTGSATPGGWLRFDGSRLTEERGTCYLKLGQYDRAGTALTQALDQTVSLRRRGSLLTDLAMLGVERRDLDQILSYGSDAVAVAEQTHSSGYVGRKLQTLQTELTSLLNDRRVALLNDRITQVSIAG